MTTQTKTQYDRAIRTAYVALDAIQLLCDRGYGTEKTERAFEQIRAIINQIEATPIRERKGAK